MAQELEAQPVAGLAGTPNLSRAGRFWFAGQPSAQGLRAAAEEGVELVINIRQPREMEALPFDEADVVERLGMQYEEIPVSPETFCAQDVERFANLIEQTRKPVLIHCGSSDRVGGMWAAYAATKQGVDLDLALVAGRKAGLRAESMVRAVRRVAGK